MVSMKTFKTFFVKETFIINIISISKFLFLNTNFQISCYRYGLVIVLFELEGGASIKRSNSMHAYNIVGFFLSNTKKVILKNVFQA